MKRISFFCMSLLVVGFFNFQLDFFKKSGLAAYQVKAQTTANSSDETAENAEDEELDDEEMTEEEREAAIEKKKKELEEAQEKSEEYENKTAKLTEKRLSLEQVISQLDSEISVTEQALLKTQKEMEIIQEAINKKQAEIDVKEEELNQKREILSEYIRMLDQLSRQSMLETLLSSGSLADYLKEIEGLNQASADIEEIFQMIKSEKTSLMIEKKALEDKKNEQVSLRIMQEQQRRYLENKKSFKQELMAQTSGEESRYQELLDEQEEMVSKISGELTALQSLGNPIDFEDAVREATYASEKTGVRVAFLLGVLKVESNMGNNVGGGSYKTDMHPAQREIFEEICDDLGYDPDKMPVSKKPCYRDEEGNCSGWGGAMGPAQFMPSTWEGYRKKVKETLGIKRPDPWNLRHAFTAMALKLAKVPGVTDGDRSAEKKAANMYLAGGNWESFTWYGDRVMTYADAFDEQL